jgi:hypothetical protein
MEFIVLIFIAVVYFAPAITAFSRKHNNGSAIFVLNLLTGWTVLGWIISAVWCSTNNIEVQNG